MNGAEKLEKGALKPTALKLGPDKKNVRLRQGIFTKSELRLKYIYSEDAVTYGQQASLCAGLKEKIKYIQEKAAVTGGFCLC